MTETGIQVVDGGGGLVTAAGRGVEGAGLTGLAGLVGGLATGLLGGLADGFAEGLADGLDVDDGREGGRLVGDETVPEAVTNVGRYVAGDKVVEAAANLTRRTAVGSIFRVISIFNIENPAISHV